VPAALLSLAAFWSQASVVGLAYVERFISVAGRPVCARNWRRVVLTAWQLAAKMWDDDCYENPDFATVLGFCVDELNQLEAAYVAALDFQLAISPSEYARYYFALRSITQISSANFPLRPLDEAVEQRLLRTGGVRR